MDKHCHGIYTRRHMLKGNSMLFKGWENFSSKSHFRIHHIFINIDCHKPFLPCNSGNGIIRLAAGALHNQSPFILRGVCVADIDGNPFFAHRKYRILMKDGCTHIGQLPQFPVGNYLDNFRLFDDPGICNQKSWHVSPVLINICPYRFCHNGTGNVRASSGKGLHSSVFSGAVKSGNHRMLTVFQPPG